MISKGDLLGGEGRKALDACVKVKIYGRPENIPKYHWERAWDRLNKCYADRPLNPLVCHGWLQDQLLQHLVLPTEWDEYGYPDKGKICDIIEIHDALVNFDEMPYVEKYPKPGPGSDELKELIDRRRADVERECQEATANPDARIQYSWLVAQRRVRDCFAGSFAGDVGLLKPKRNPNELYNIIDIHDAVVYYDERYFLESDSYVTFGSNDKKWWKEHRAERDDVEREFKEAISTTDKVIKEYSRREAELRVKNCYRRDIDQLPEDILPIKKGNNGEFAETYNIFDIHKALQKLDERKFLQKYPNEGPGSDELRMSIDANNFDVRQEYGKAKSRFRSYSLSEAEKKVRDCFARTLPEHLAIFPTMGDETEELSANHTYDILDIHNAVQRMSIYSAPSRQLEPEKVAKLHRDSVSKEYEKAISRLHGYSKNEAERRVRDCFAGTILVDPWYVDADIFPTKGEKTEIPKTQQTCNLRKICEIKKAKTQQTYDIFEIQNAIHHFDQKKLCDKYLDEKDPESERNNKSAGEQRAEIEAEYTKATQKMEIDHGSGFIIHDHFIVTNKHVIVDVVNDKTKEICISNAAIGELNCEVIEDDGLKDLALLYCNNLNLKQNGVCPLQLSDQPLLTGMQIFSFGYPMSHKGKKAIFVNGHVSGSEETYSKLCLLGHTMAVLNCPLNPGNSGGPVLCWVNGQLKVVGVATQKHFKEILTFEEREKIEKIRESLQTSSITSVSDDAIKHASLEQTTTTFFLPSFSHDNHQELNPCQTPMFLLTLKLYDALETHSQFNLSNALPGHCVIEFIKETIRKNKGKGKEELLEVIKLSESHENVLPSGHLSASKCCVQ